MMGTTQCQEKMSIDDFNTYISRSDVIRDLKLKNLERCRRVGDKIIKHIENFDRDKELLHLINCLEKGFKGVFFYCESDLKWLQDQDLERIKEVGRIKFGSNVEIVIDKGTLVLRPIQEIFKKIIPIDDEYSQKDIVKRLEKLEQKIEEMDAKLRKIYFSPGMPGFMEAQKDFEEHKN